MSRKRKMMKRRRLTVALGLIVMMSLMMNYAMAKRAVPEVMTVVVKSGESVWSIARSTNPGGKDLRRHVYEIIDINSIEDGVIYAGQELSVPLN